MNLHESVRRRFGLPLSGVDSQTLVKAEGVFRAGKVQWVHEALPGRLDAAVTGSNGESYRTSIQLDRRFQTLSFSATCSCPVGVDCKHGVAALLAWLRDGDDGDDDTVGNSPSSAGVPTSDPETARQRSLDLLRRQHALHWARELGSIKLPGPGGASDGPHLRYVLAFQGREAYLSAFRMRRLKDGGFSRADRYTALREQALSPPGFWDEIDALVARALLTEVRHFVEGHALTGAHARDALLALARAGRLYLDKPPEHADDRPLEPGPAVPARLAWLAEPAGEAGDTRALRLGLDLQPPRVPVYSAEPFYVDREAAVIGLLETDVPAALMGWLRDAPPVLESAAPEVATALHAHFRSKPALRERIPALPRQQVRELTMPPRFVLGLFTTAATGFRNRPQPRMRSFLAVSLAVDYGGRQVEPLRHATIGLQSEDGPALVVCDQAAERRALASLRDSLSLLGGTDEGFNLAPHRGVGGTGASSGWLTVATLRADSVGAARVKHDLAPALLGQGWLLEDHSALPTTVVAPDEVVVALRTAGNDSQGRRPESTRERTTADWFQLQSGIQVGEQQIDLAPLLAFIVAMGGFDAWAKVHCPQGLLWMKVSDGVVLRLEAKRIEPLARVVADWAEHQGSRDAHRAADGPPPLLLSPFAAAQLAGVVTATTGLPESVRRLRGLVDGFKGLEPVQAPASFLAELRPYQRDGLAWLQFIGRAGLGGVLADDMGLGKTIQVLAHIDCERAAGRLADPVLVVAPTSVIFNWQAEAERHAPELRVLALTGSGRSEHFQAIGNHDLVLTSYALLSRDAGVLRERQWHAVVLDEAQMIKNPRTQAAAVARALRTGHRLALTGTPLENHLGELWSIMQFVLPGLLGSEEAFRSRFRTPIEKQAGSDLAAERLRSLESRVRPFLLRRTKAAVLADLPPRTEIIQRIDLSTEQRDLYESIRAAMDKRVRQALARSGLAGSQIVLLDALLKLRQACCDPALVKLPGARKGMRSAKRDALLELLATLVDEGRRALVFSQFTTMLDLIEVAIDADPRLAAVPRTRLDGSTTDRGGAVEQFQQGDAQLFLLSLKAGGVGLNLTAADTVIHYDPWWNPAVENQATDRAHRIGQDKPVFIYKLIAAGTVEERILALQARKAELAAAVLSGSLAAGGKALAQEDLLGLFEPF